MQTPVQDTTRESRPNPRLSDEEARLIREAAERETISMSAFMRRAAVTDAKVRLGLAA